jgi:tRNA-specific 2-thiouridylase
MVDNVNWISIAELREPITTRVRIRYLHSEAEAVITPLEKARVRVKFNQPQAAITPGQAAVFYNGDVVVGGGTIEEVVVERT